MSYYTRGILDQTPHFVYRLYSTGQQLAYVGCTINLTSRFAGHPGEDLGIPLKPLLASAAPYRPRKPLSCYYSPRHYARRAAA